MNQKRVHRKSEGIIRWVSLVAVSIVSFSCVRQFEELDVVDVPQGEPARVSLTFSVPEMPAMTRAAGIDPDTEDARTLQDLWIGFYDSNTGYRVADQYISLNVKLSHHQVRRIDNIPTVSGKCIIVAVANVGINSGLIAGKDQKPTLLSDLLRSDAASTFGGFQQIAMVMGSPDAVVRTSPSLVMCGTYSRDRSVTGPNSLAGGNPHGNDDDMTPVDIYPGNNTLAGAIHLRRLDSYITFNLIPAANVTVTPLSWQVCNLPGIGYVFDQKGKNAADLAAAPGTEIWTQWSSGDSTSGDNAEANAALNASYYHNSQIFGSNMFGRLTTGGFSFDFFQMENKHTGLLEGTLGSNGVSEWYPLREREYKTDEDGLNTGWYKSLVSETDYRTVANTLAAPSAESGLSNNNASFVVIRARVEYYYRIDGNGTPVSNYQPVAPPADPNDPTYVRRVGNALYTIHLGYCDGKDGGDNPTLATANDFNCFRNTKYTYTVHINGVDNIRVEAVSDTTEPQSGAEGTVTDLVSTLITLDSHYGVFNLGLTDAERKALFWRIQSPFDNQVIDLVGYSGSLDNLFDGSNLIDVTNDPDIRAALPKNQFYNWIQIRPTTDAETVAEYPGDPRLIGRRIRNIDNQADDWNIIYPLNQIEPNPYWNEAEQRIEGIFPEDYNMAKASEKTGTYIDVVSGENKGVWYLEQLCDPDHFPHPFNTSVDEEEVKWYTFFIDEFVYEYEYDPNQNSLTAEYDDIPGDNYQGKEEMFSGTMDIDKWRTFANQDNRRLWLGLGNMYISKDRESIYSNALYLVTQESIQTYYGDEAEDGIGLEHTNESYRGSIGSTTDWWDIYNNGAYNDVDGLLNMYNFVTKNQNRSYGERVNWANVRMTEESSVKTTKLRVGAYHTKGVAVRGMPTEGDVAPFTYYIPDHPDKFMMGCLARNRDLNHDDIVGANEMRWYLPTTPVYTRMMLGAVSLRTPLFNAAEYDQNSIIAGTGTHFSHYAGSDNRQLWAEELAAIGGLGNARTMRCVRNLGQYMNLSPNEDAYKLINAAYIERKAEDGSNPRETVRIIDMAYYHPVALRPAIQERDYLPIHDVTSILSAASRSFKYARSDCNTSNIDEGWRLGQLKPGPDGKMAIGDETLWTESASMNGICRAYYENWDRSDLGTWRVPNITELGVLVLLGIVNLDPERHISCTREYFIGEPEKSGRNRYYMKVGGGDKPIENMITASAGANGNIYLRCVKDVIE